MAYLRFSGILLAAFISEISPTAYDPTCLYTQQGQFYAESNIMQGTDTQVSCETAVDQSRN